MTLPSTKEQVRFNMTEQFNSETGLWEPAIPEPFYWGLFPWLWKRLTGYRDEYGRKAQLFWEFGDDD